MSSHPVPPQNIIDEFVGVSHGDLGRVKALLQQYPTLVNVNPGGNETPIQAAAQTGQREIVNLLLAAGAPLDICTAAVLGERERVADMLRADASLAQAKGAHGLPALYYPAIIGRVDIAELLLAHGAPVNGGEGISPPLHGAVYFGQLKMVEWLLQHGAAVNVRDFKNKTALQAALDNKRNDMADLIRRHGGKAMAAGFVKVDGGQLYYETAGEGRPLILIHACVADSRMWDEQFDVFAQHYRVIRYDLRGFGRTQSDAVAFSPGQDLYKLLKQLQVEKIYVLGLSCGGGIAVDFTLEHPEMVGALIPVAAGLSGYEHPQGSDEKSVFESEFFKRMEAVYEQRDFEQVQAMELQVWVDGPMQPAGRASQAVRARVHEMNANAFKVQQSAEPKWQPLEPRAAQRLAEINIPTLVIYGDLDATSVIGACEHMAKHIVGARKVVIPGTAHMLNMEKPEEFNRIVLDFLSKLPSVS